MKRINKLRIIILRGVFIKNIRYILDLELEIQIWPVTALRLIYLYTVPILIDSVYWNFNLKKSSNYNSAVPKQPII